MERVGVSIRGALRPERRQGGDRALHVVGVGDVDLDDVDATQRLELIGGALGDDLAVVDDGDASGRRR
jgi:hypothetical protein